MEKKCLVVKCDSCGQLMDQPGALLFTPPIGKDSRDVEKYHICVKCYELLFRDIINKPKSK